MIQGGLHRGLTGSAVYGFSLSAWGEGDGFGKASVSAGEGEYVWPDGRKYKGPFHDGLMEGSFGVYEWPAGGTGNACQISVPGVSPQGLSPSKTARLAPPGKGTPSSVSAAAAPAASFVCRYEGPFSAGQKDGNGVLFMSDGRRIEGTFIANRLEGQAVLVMPSGGSRRGAVLPPSQQPSALFKFAHTTSLRVVL